MELWLWVLILLLLVLLFTPRYGLLAWLQRRDAVQDRQRFEDALKLIFEAQWQSRPISLRGLAAALQLQDARLLDFLQKMQKQGLLHLQGRDVLLTPQGERMALQVTRAHRLLERYLADEARMPLQDIHREAERREHNLTAEQVDELEAALGFPRRDPHGDPIPNRDGQFPAALGTPLTAWLPDTPAKIVHLEDEPPLAYAQILAEGLFLGQKVRLLEAAPERYLLTDGENEYRLAPAVAANVFVEELPETALNAAELLRLGDLPSGEQAEIVRLDDACQGFTRRRFLDLGLTPGAKIYPELQNIFRDPRAYRLRGTLIALRKEQARQIWVKVM